MKAVVNFALESFTETVFRWAPVDTFDGKMMVLTGATVTGANARLCSSFLENFYNWKKAGADRKHTTIRMMGVHILSGLLGALCWARCVLRASGPFPGCVPPECSHLQARTGSFSY